MSAILDAAVSVGWAMAIIVVTAAIWLPFVLFAGNVMVALIAYIERRMSWYRRLLQRLIDWRPS